MKRKTEPQYFDAIECTRGEKKIWIDNQLL